MLGIHVSKKSKIEQKDRSDMLDAIEDDLTSLDLNAAQIFTHGPRNRNKNKMDYHAVEQYCIKNDVTLVVHSTYLTHPWKVNNENKTSNISKSELHHLTDQLKSCFELGAIGLVVHLPKRSVDEIVETMHILQPLVLKTGSAIILEIEAGKYDAYGNPDNLNDLCKTLHAELKPADYNWWGICIDTAHLWANNVDIRTKQDALDWFKKLTPKTTSKIELVHLNGSTVPFGSNKDEHAIAGSKLDHIWGQTSGHLKTKGISVFIKFCKKKKIPIICEINRGSEREVEKSLREIKDILY